MAVGLLGLIASVIVGTSWRGGRNTTIVEDDGGRHFL
jgi:hypothetical protein